MCHLITYLAQRVRGGDDVFSPWVSLQLIAGLKQGPKQPEIRSLGLICSCSSWVLDANESSEIGCQTGSFLYEASCLMWIPISHHLPAAPVPLGIFDVAFVLTWQLLLINRTLKDLRPLYSPSSPTSADNTCPRRLDCITRRQSAFEPWWHSLCFWVRCQKRFGL